MDNKVEILLEYCYFHPIATSHKKTTVVVQWLVMMCFMENEDSWKVLTYEMP